MKLSFLLSIFFFVSICAKSQVLKFKIFQHKVIQKDKSGEYGVESRSIDTTGLVVINDKKNVITIYMAGEKKFDVIERESYHMLDKIFAVYKYVCIDKDGKKCSVRLIVPTELKGTADVQVLVIDYLDRNFIYRMSIN